MKRVVEVRPDSIVVENRHRRDLGDLSALMDSIREVGMLQPIVCRTGDGKIRLVAGERRLEACKRLGHKIVPVLVVERLDDATKALIAERDENECRKAMTPLELKSLTDALLEIEQPAAKERQRQGQELGRAVRRGDVDHVVRNHEPQRAKAEAAKAAGWSRSQYERVERVEKASQDDALPQSVRAVADTAIEKMEAGEMSPNQADQAVKDAKVDAGVGATADRVDKAKRANPPAPTPTASGKSRAEIEHKIATYSRMAAEGYTSRQIADAINITIENMPGFRRRHGLDKPAADAVIGKTRHHDSNRIMSETVASLEGICIGIELIDFDDLESADLDYWVSSLSDSIRALTSLRNTIKKELTSVAS